MAIESYHQRHGCFPPAFIADKSGRPMASWRVLLTAELQPTFYRYYRFDEPWNGPNNSKLARRVQNLFRCPSDDNDGPKGSEHETSYVVVVGSKTAFPGDKCVALSDITDDQSNTILVVEVQNSGIHWMEPRDLHVTQMAPGINPVKGQGISSKHRGGANVVMADGSVKYLDAEKLTAEDVQSLLTIDGNEPPPIPLQ
jgi:prepilin-type processing-associated H-X9-DG protein